MPLHSTKEKKGARSIHFNFVVQGRFRPVSSVSVASRYDSISPARPDSGRINPVRRESEGKKKKKAQTQHRPVGNRVGKHQTQVWHPPSRVCTF